MTSQIDSTQSTLVPDRRTRQADFIEIQIQFHDKNGSERPQSKWEIYLGEEKKGLVPLGNSGSGLKTVILVLLNLLVVPHFEKKPKSQYVFAFEELENNLHPALLRRVLQFIEDYAVKEDCLVLSKSAQSAPPKITSKCATLSGAVPQ